MSELVNETYGPFLVDPKEGCTVSINVGIGIGIGFPGGGGGAAATPLLDEVGSAFMALSLRKLRDAYSGSAIRVRESGGDTEADIGFTASGDLDTAALLSHCGSNSGYVVTWYDQSGNSRDATQSTAANQPRIVNAGSVEGLGGKPSLRHVNAAGANAEYLRASFGEAATLSTEFFVGQGGDNQILTHSGDGTVNEWHTPLTSGSTAPSLSQSVGTPSWRKNGADQSPSNRGDLYTLYGTEQSIATIETVGFNGFTGYQTAYNTTTTAYRGFEWQQERVVYASELSASDVATVEANMAAYYGITLS